FDETIVLTDLRQGGDPTASTIVSKFDAHDVVSSLRWSPDESQLSWTTDGGDFQIADARARSSQLQIPLYTYLQIEKLGGLFTHEYLNNHS
uniref:Dipeptidylpeptidase IV N-terminal domain-containing protein n=1 Tax=Globisporangium ultimum (strain ATCC 200006 / CBS 805.95 / DAOM BR144) TaxID=431595 RepID=K3WUS3_GLOUD